MGKKNTKKAAKNAGTKAAKNATAKVSKNVGKEPRWKRCSICSKIPPSSGEFYKGGDLESGGFVPEVAKLKVVGYSSMTRILVDDRTVILKRRMAISTCHDPISLPYQVPPL